MNRFPDDVRQSIAQTLRQTFYTPETVKPHKNSTIITSKELNLKPKVKPDMKFLK